MLGLITSFIGGLLSSSRASETAIDYLRKAGSLDEMTAKDKSQWLLDYMQATKHQSPMRRI